MNHLELVGTFMFLIQLVHSSEELLTGFHKKWFLFKMPFKVFLGFEIIHNSFWASVLLFQQFPQREILITLFIYLMLANGLEHIIWAFIKRKYVPGLITAPIHILLFLIYIS